MGPLLGGAVVAQTQLARGELVGDARTSDEDGARGHQGAGAGVDGVRVVQLESAGQRREHVVLLVADPDVRVLSLGGALLRQGTLDPAKRFRGRE